MKKPFQIGERAVGRTKYGGWETRGKISAINKNAIEIKNELGLFWFHRKEVRRLKPKKKAREWSLLLRKDGSYGTIHPANTKAGKIGKNYELVRVREVL